MKNEIDSICEIMDVLLAYQPIIDVPYEKINDIAIALVKEGYGNISQYKIKIEQLTAKNKVLKDGVTKAFGNGLNNGRKQAEKNIKQAKIDVLKKLRSRISDKEALIQSYIADGCLTIDDMYTDIDELIKEVEEQ